MIDWPSSLPHPLSFPNFGSFLPSLPGDTHCRRRCQSPGGHIHTWSVPCISLNAPSSSLAAPAELAGSLCEHLKDLRCSLKLLSLCLALFIEIVHRILLKTKTKVNGKIFMGSGGPAATERLKVVLLGHIVLQNAGGGGWGEQGLTSWLSSAVLHPASQGFNLIMLPVLKSC